ncbi:MAG TPA: hypothetical protein PL193_09945 [Xanthobacteraceae bacterium]|nr:hypothetical protein [Xanthobacteraceae bacterium]
MSGKSLAILVVSPHERSGTTLIARLFADFFRIAGQAPLLFDTDAQRPKFSKYFPDATLVDLGTTKGRMSLFDTLPVRTLQPKVVDVTHRAYSDFFTLVRDIDLIAEARSNNVEPVIVYVPHYVADDFERGFRLRAYFDCEFMLAENAYLGPAPEELHRVNAYWALKAHPVRLQLPALDPMAISLLEDERVSISEFLLTSVPGYQPPPGERPPLPLAYLSFDARSKIRNWLKPTLREVQRAVHLVQTRQETPVSEPQPF